MSKNQNKKDPKYSKGGNYDERRTRRDGMEKNSDKGTYDGDKRSKRPGKDVRHSANHIEWYVPDNNMLADVASIPFNYRAGDTLPVYGDAPFSVPGVVRLQYIPTLGELTNASDPANVAATAVYSWIRHANSGSRNYDNTDLMLYLMAMDSIYTGIAYVMRALNTAMLYSANNRYLPNTLLRGMGITTSSEFFGKQAEYRYRLNNIILKAATLAVPATFPLYSRHIWMVSNIYTDEPNTNAQMYVFAPTYLWKLGLDSEGKGQLSTVGWTPTQSNAAGTGTMVIDAYMSVLEDMLDTLYGDEDSGIMSGDILKAYGKENLFSLSTIANDTVTLPVYDVNVLNQIHNATVMGNVKCEPIKQVITETGDGFTGYLTGEMWVTKTSPALGALLSGNKLLDIHGPTGPEEVMRSTRLVVPKATPDYEATPNNYVLHDYGTEVITTVVMYKMENGDVFNDVYDGPIPVTLESAYMASVASQISYMPAIILYDSENADDSSSYAIFVNTDNSTVLTAEAARKLNETALLGLFNVPRITLGNISK